MANSPRSEERPKGITDWVTGRIIPVHIQWLGSGPPELISWGHREARGSEMQRVGYFRMFLV